MRRLQLEASLVVLWLLASGIFGYASDSSKPDRTGSRTTQPEAKKDKVFSRVVSGWGETVEDAEQDALKHAREELLVFFANQGVALSWKPPLDYIRDSLFGGDWEKKDSVELPGVGWVREVRFRVELSASDYRKILRHDHEYVAQNRMILFGKVLAGLVALLAAVAGYFRLEEATKGYYTAWLRLATLAFVAAVGAGLWLIS